MCTGKGGISVLGEVVIIVLGIKGHLLVSVMTKYDVDSNYVLYIAPRASLPNHNHDSDASRTAFIIHNYILTYSVAEVRAPFLIFCEVHYYKTGYSYILILIHITDSVINSCVMYHQAYIHKYSYMIHASLLTITL